MILLDGKKTSQDIKEEIKTEVDKMKANGEKVPHLAAVIVGNDGASLCIVIKVSMNSWDILAGFNVTV